MKAEKNKFMGNEANSIIKGPISDSYLLERSKHCGFKHDNSLFSRAFQAQVDNVNQKFVTDHDRKLMLEEPYKTKNIQKTIETQEVKKKVKSICKKFDKPNTNFILNGSKSILNKKKESFMRTCSAYSLPKNPSIVINNNSKQLSMSQKFETLSQKTINTSKHTNNAYGEELESPIIMKKSAFAG